MSDVQRPNGGDGSNPTGPDGPGTRVQIVGQYVKDLSFENPGAPLTLTSRPQIDLGVDLQARQLDPERYEVELKLRVSAKVEEKTAFMLELVYAGLFLIVSAPPGDSAAHPADRRAPHPVPVRAPNRRRCNP